MHHATNPTTSTPKKHPANQSDLSQNAADRSCRFRKAIGISDNITLVDVALERVRQSWLTKKARKAGKEGIPPNIAQLITQALTISRTHLMDYRELVAQEQGRKQEAAQGATIPSENILQGLHPFHTMDGERLKEPHEPIEKIKAVLSLLMASQDEETAELLISVSQAGWAFLLLSDLVEEAEYRAIGYQDHSRALYLEVEKRLKPYALVRRDPSNTVPCESLQEVR